MRSLCLVRAGGRGGCGGGSRGANKNFIHQNKKQTQKNKIEKSRHTSNFFFCFFCLQSIERCDHITCSLRHVEFFFL